jgi:hypothetical protein
VIGTDVQNTTLPDKKPAKAIPASKKRDMIKSLIASRVKREMNPYGS